jgi:hypothetical protein
MSLDPRYITAPSLQEYFVDKDSGFPLAGGKVFFYSDVNRTTPKDVFELTGSPPNYSFSPLPNPVILSSVGTMMDNNGNDIIPYYFPFDANGNQELYYIVVQSATGVPQFTREAWPNPQTGETPVTQNNFFNYIPNGQFLLHTDLPNNELVAGSNVIAQGGWTFELPLTLHSINTLQYIPINFTENPSNSPRFYAQFTCGAAGLDTIKSVRIKWNDVNKFSATTDFFTFAFWARTDIDVPIAIDIIKYCGTTGSVVPPQEIFTDVITPAGQMYVYSFQFPSNAGLVIDTVNNDDYIALDIFLPVGISFVLTMTDVAMVDGEVNLQEFPLQTNADMVTRGNDGWTNISAYNGYDLSLPKVQTRYGYEYADWEVGDGGFTYGNIVSPLSTSPLPRGNRMALDGASYIYADYSTIGIPFARLGDFLIANSPIPNTPMFGTGADFATAYTNAGNVDLFRLTVNSDGSGPAYAIDGSAPTGFTFTGIPTYNGSTVGSGFLNWTAWTLGSIPATFWMKANFSQLSTGNTTTQYVIVGTSGFALHFQDFFQGLLAQQSANSVVQCNAASTLITGAAGKYFYFYTDTALTAALSYYVWFNTGTETDPGAPVAGSRPIEIKVNSTDTAQDVSNTIQEVINAYQSTNISVGVVPPASSYFTFQSNPSAVTTYFVWYEVNGAGSEPIVAGAIGIKVSILNTDSHAIIVTKTLIAINKYKYAVPAAQGMFFRNYDPNGIWDTDNLARFSNVTGIKGPDLGTFEYSQFLSHNHTVTVHNPLPSFNHVIAEGESTANPVLGDEPTNLTGGNETRPVNMYVNYYIKY